MRYTKAERAEEGGKKKNRYWMWVEEGMNKGEEMWKKSKRLWDVGKR